MFAFVEGEPVGRGSDYVVISIAGMGFRVFVPPSRIEEITVQPLVKLHTHMAVREDNISLFGMQTEDELTVFRQLISVSGVGPRLALAVLSTWNVAQLEQIIIREDANALVSVAGIGRKTAQRLLLELKDKITAQQTTDGTIGLVVDAEAALVALGYRSNEVRPVIRALARECNSVEDLVRRALSRLAGGDK